MFIIERTLLTPMKYKMNPQITWTSIETAKMNIKTQCPVIWNFEEGKKWATLYTKFRWLGDLINS